MKLDPVAQMLRDLLAGLNNAVNGVPDGMATALLVGVNPVYGLYAGMVGPIAGGIFSSTKLMVITTTSAAALAAAQTLGGVPAEERASALFVMVILIGVLQLAAGALRVGRLMRFVSHSVMTGLLLGIAVLIVLSQLPDAAGYQARGEGTFAKALDLLRHLGDVKPASLGVAGAALVLAIVLPRTRLGAFGLLAAIALPSVLAVMLALAVEQVHDVGQMPQGLPTLFVPSFEQAFQVAGGAMAVSAILLVQAAGVSRNVPNPDGSPSKVSQDILAQGVANLACGLLRGVPVGASLSATALGIASGAASRWASVFAGLWMVAIVLLFPELIGEVALPALAALLIVAAAGAVEPREIVSVWRTGWPSRAASLLTFAAVLVLPIEIALVIAGGISALVYASESPREVMLVELAINSKDRVEERPVSRRLRAHDVTVLDVHGRLLFTGADGLRALLPDPGDAHNAVLILRLRHRREVGGMLVEVLSEYAEKLKAVNGRLYLTGVSWAMRRQLERTGKLPLSGPVRVYEARPVPGQATASAFADAKCWLVGIGQRAE